MDSSRIALLIELVLVFGAMGDHVPLELLLALLLFALLCGLEGPEAYFGLVRGDDMSHLRDTLRLEVAAMAIWQSRRGPPKDGPYNLRPVRMSRASHASPQP